MKANTHDSFEERDLKVIISALGKRGWTVRREKLSRGPAFRVKSGTCEVFGEKVLFLDRSLPTAQQLSFLTDHLIESGIELDHVEFENLSEGVRQIYGRESSRRVEMPSNQVISSDNGMIAA